ncbi:hypothetical protein Q9S36_08470 [Microbacterium sp. ARD31]|jgi:hypothetical protein|uniref:hypothetical protein n=1 Tax=Microbacterium sp. ARD31 TaxID=2962576 RepID=UPI002881CF3C|nr:hypothetical protein [Microbacterium sp. ARD31]MDT0180242.1 hypothetical protein [Microbacterium sp. ARD31]
MRSSAKVLLVLPLLGLLAGCTATTLPEFQAEQTDRDVIRDTSAHEGVDVESTRYVGDVEGAELYLARGDEGDTLCLIHIRDQEWEQMGCGAGLGLGTVLPSGTRIEAGTFRFPAEEVGDGEREQLSESVAVITYP